MEELNKGNENPWLDTEPVEFDDSANKRVKTERGSLQKLYRERLEDIYDLMVAGGSYRDIVAEIGGNITSLHIFLAKPEYAERTRLASEMGADACAEKALAAIRTAHNGDKCNVWQNNREADYWWAMAKLKNREKYGDKPMLDLNAGNIQIVIDDKAAKL